MGAWEDYDRANPPPQPVPGMDYAQLRQAWLDNREAVRHSPEMQAAMQADSDFWTERRRIEADAKARLNAARRASSEVIIFDDERMHRSIAKTSFGWRYLHPDYENNEQSL